MSNIIQQELDKYVNKMSQQFLLYCLEKEKFIHASNIYAFACRSYPPEVINQAMLAKNNCETVLKNTGDVLAELYHQYELYLDISTNPKNVDDIANVLCLLFSNMRATNEHL